MPARVVIVRGHLATPWELRQWRELPARFDVSYLLTASNGYDVSDVGLRAEPVRSLRDRFPRGLVGEVLTGVAGDRYFELEERLAGADIVHAEELSFWFAAEAARVRERCGFKVVQTVWETIPFLGAYRNRHARRYRARVLAGTDLFLPATERARDALLLEGVPADRIEICAPGIDLDRFAGAAQPDPPPDEHLILSAGRAVWEKGHQDVLRAVAALHRGLVTGENGVRLAPRALIVGRGTEERRLREHAHELGLGDAVEFRPHVPYEEMPAVYARSSCLVLASLAAAMAPLHPFDRPHAFWEEQFGLVLAEAMAAGLPIVASTSGAIPEVVGEHGRYFTPGDWLGLARELAAGPLSRAPATRVQYPRERVQGFSTVAAGQRLAAAYDRLLGTDSG